MPLPGVVPKGSARLEARETYRRGLRLSLMRCLLALLRFPPGPPLRDLCRGFAALETDVTFEANVAARREDRRRRRVKIDYLAGRKGLVLRPGWGRICSELPQSVPEDESVALDRYIRRITDTSTHWQLFQDG